MGIDSVSRTTNWKKPPRFFWGLNKEPKRVGTGETATEKGRWRGRQNVGLCFYLLSEYLDFRHTKPLFRNPDSFHPSLTFQGFFLFYCKYSSRRKINRQEKNSFIQYTESDRKYRMEKNANNQQIKSGDEPRKRTSWLQVHSAAWARCNNGFCSW